jgi:beta-lactamase regulating signal transducer with metallopeptidase domain
LTVSGHIAPLVFPMDTPLWFSNLLSWSLQVMLSVVLAGILPYLFRIRQPRLLLAYWRGLLVISFLLPIIQPWHHLRIIGAFLVTRELLPITFPPSPPAVAHWQFPNADLLAQIFGVLILAGITLRLALLALGLFKLRQFRRASRPISPPPECFIAPAQMRSWRNTRAEFRLSAKVDSPVTFGFAAPVVLLPERFSSLEPRFQTAIVCHELVHVRRRDWVHHLAEEVLRAAFWFHPAIAWLIARLRLAREQVVDLEVVTLTDARKTYVEALLEFTTIRPRIPAMPGPLFLTERQLVKRVALLLKEVRMSRKRLIASFAVITSCLALALLLAVGIFPLRGAPVAAEAPRTGATGGVSGGISAGVSGGISGGVTGGVSGGINGERQKAQSSSEPSVAYNTIWVDTVKRGPMVRQIRGLGKLVQGENSTLLAKITMPVNQTVDIRPNQSAAVDTRMGVVKGHVVSISPSGDTCSIDVALDSALPERATVGLTVDGTIEIEKLENVLHVGRPVHGEANISIGLFRISKDGSEAERVPVKLGRSSVNAMEVLDGLNEGDKIILSDMSAYDNAERIRLTNPPTQ